MKRRRDEERRESKEKVGLREKRRKEAREGERKE